MHEGPWQEPMKMYFSQKYVIFVPIERYFKERPWTNLSPWTQQIQTTGPWESHASLMKLHTKGIKIIQTGLLLANWRIVLPWKITVTIFQTLFLWKRGICPSLYKTKQSEDFQNGENFCLMGRMLGSWFIFITANRWIKERTRIVMPAVSNVVGIEPGDKHINIHLQGRR